ncbi:zinc metallochaperone AztD [Leucobacter sp. UT-8R-CII-1-4]|uniref:zinc metallochaperone AztD n=1 Tax=Leucobacter sp. UT-8R-CII-1-4 TaxID=3040075 RepID=UPI0024A9B4C0|nr:zinc metallochaperone AztD [Leucobacter sp. UT-8R-CII-1-4]MDI6022610.1 zinc metallochaperone AztD [Leucobacter sp. UT-8R-CII-1-4]
MKSHFRVIATTAAFAGITLLATACASGTAASTTADDPSSSQGAAEGRVAVSYEGGIAVLDPETLEVLQEFSTEEFTRLNTFGDKRTVAVTTSAGFQMLDTADLKLTDLVFDAKTAGHVVAHEGKTVLYDDGTGTTTVLDTAAFAGGYQAPAETSTYTAAAPHHGVSIVLRDGTLLTTVGDSNGRSGAAALHPHDDHWHEEAVSNECPGIHGEGTAANEVVVFGCENGALLYANGEFTKLTAPDSYGRMGNAFVSETSPLVVGDYKNDPDAEGYLLSAVTLIDTEKQSYEVVNLPAEVRYTFRDIARGPGDLAYILSNDGQIHVLDPASGKLTDSYPVVDPWQGPAEWQDAHPAIKVNGDIAYITEPATNSVHAVDLKSGKILASSEFDFTPNELAVAMG